MTSDRSIYRLCLVTDRDLARGRPLVDVVAAAVQGGVTMVQLREKTATTRAFLEEARALQTLEMEVSQIMKVGGGSKINGFPQQCRVAVVVGC